MARRLVSRWSGRCVRAWRGLLKIGERLAERAVVKGPGAGLLAVSHGLVPHLAP